METYKCPSCSKTTGGNEKFCIACGTALDIKCPNCEHTWRYMYEYKFCPNCGQNMQTNLILTQKKSIETT